jgi:hypothetical protein
MKSQLTLLHKSGPKGHGLHVAEKVLKNAVLKGHAFLVVPLSSSISARASAPEGSSFVPAMVYATSSSMKEGGRAWIRFAAS